MQDPWVAGKKFRLFPSNFFMQPFLLPNSKLGMPTSSNHTEVSVHCCHGKHTVTNLWTLLSDLVYLFKICKYNYHILAKFSVILHCFSDCKDQNYRLQTGFILVIGFIELLQAITTNTDYACTVLHTSEITIGHTTSSQSVSLHYPLLGSGFNSRRSPSSGFPTVPGLSYQALLITSWHG
jgi:hypothetical protein